MSPQQQQAYFPTLSPSNPSKKVGESAMGEMMGEDGEKPRKKNDEDRRRC